MTLILGVDPGLHGAFALYDSDAMSLLEVADTPTWEMPVGGKRRTELDFIGLSALVQRYRALGVRFAIVELVGGLPRQSAPAAFNFGYATGILHASLRSEGIAVELVRAQTWKKLMRVPGKRLGGNARETTLEIIAVADRLFPEHIQTWRGPQGGYKLDRAEAALLARYGALTLRHFV